MFILTIVAIVILEASVFFVVRGIKKVTAYQAHFSREASDARANAFVVAYLAEHPEHRLSLDFTPKSKAGGQRQVSANRLAELRLTTK